MICIYDCDYDEGKDNTALETSKILDGIIDTVVFRVKENEFPSSTEKYQGFIVTGSPKSIFDNTQWISPLRKILTTKKPVLGICLGHQLLADIRGGTVIRMSQGRNFGYKKVILTKEGVTHPLFKGIKSPLLTFFSHRFIVKTLPENAVLLAHDSLGVQAFQHENYYGVQFHPDFPWPMANRLAKKYDLDPLYPGDYQITKSWEWNKHIIINFAHIVKDSTI